MMALITVAVLLSPGAERIQSPPQPVPAPAAQGGPASQRKPPGTEGNEEVKDFGSLQAEMIERANLSYRDSEHKRVVKSAEDILRWSQRLSGAARQNPRRPLSGALDLLGEIEKSARRIRSIYGVGATIDELESPPGSWTEGVGKMEAVARQLMEEVKKTRRQVISIPVITGSDTIILLSRWLRESVRTLQ